MHRDRGLPDGVDPALRQPHQLLARVQHAVEIHDLVRFKRIVFTAGLGQKRLDPGVLGRDPVVLGRFFRLERFDAAVLPVDERWVDEDDAQSNARLIRQQLLRECATAARFISLKHPTSQPQAAQEACNARLATLEQPLDVVVLGMGLDGHTASLFPDAPELADALASTRCCHALSPASQPTARMSLTPALLNAARRRVLHIEGEDKRRVLDAVLADPQALRYPIAMALTAEAAAPLQIYWAA